MSPNQQDRKDDARRDNSHVEKVTAIENFTFSSGVEKLQKLVLSDNIGRDELKCLRRFSELFNPPGNPLRKPVSRSAFIESLRWMSSDLDDEKVEPFVAKLVDAGMLYEVPEAHEVAILLPTVMREQSKNLVDQSIRYTGFSV